MECPHKTDIEEIKKDIKQLLAYMHEEQGRKSAINNIIYKISAIISFLVSSLIAIVSTLMKSN